MVHNPFGEYSKCIWKVKRVRYPRVISYARTGQSMQGYITDGVVVCRGDYVDLSIARSSDQIILLKVLQEKKFRDGYYDVVAAEYNH